MPKEVVRTHIVVPKELVESVEEIVGARHRSEYFAEAVEEKLRRIKLLRAAKEVCREPERRGHPRPGDTGVCVGLGKGDTGRSRQETWGEVEQTVSRYLLDITSLIAMFKSTGYPSSPCDRKL